MSTSTATIILLLSFLIFALTLLIICVSWGNKKNADNKSELTLKVTMHFKHRGRKK